MERFEEVKHVIGIFLIKEVGFKKENVRFVPCSGYTGENLVTRQGKKFDWYTGPTLIETIDTFPSPKRAVDMPLRMSIVDFFKGGAGGSNSVTVMGRIESGGVQIGEQVQIAPLSEYAIVKSIEMDGNLVQYFLLNNHR